MCIDISVCAYVGPVVSVCMPWSRYTVICSQKETHIAIHGDLECTRSAVGICVCALAYIHSDVGLMSLFKCVSQKETHTAIHSVLDREVGGWGRDPKKCTGRDWGMGSSTI